MWSNTSLYTVITWCMWLYASLTSTGSNIEMASIFPWHTSQLSTHLELWKVAGNQCILDFEATSVWIPLIGRRARATPVLSFMADTSLILALPSFWSLWLFSMSMLSFSPNCWSGSWASQDVVRPFTTRLLMYAPKTSCMTCAMHDMWCLNAGHWIAEASSVDCSSRVIDWFEQALSVVIPSNQPLVSSKRTSALFKCMASLAPVCWQLTYDRELTFKTEKEQEINLIECKLNFTQCPVSIHIGSNDRCYG